MELSLFTREESRYSEHLNKALTFKQAKGDEYCPKVLKTNSENPLNRSQKTCNRITYLTIPYPRLTMMTRVRAKERFTAERSSASITAP